jgi:hypothetical protein
MSGNEGIAETQRRVPMVHTGRICARKNEWVLGVRCWVLGKYTQTPNT